MQHLLPKYDKVFSRIYDFATRATSGALINIDLCGSGYPLPPHTPFPRWQFPDDLYRYLNEQIDFVLETWEHKAGLDDDTVPALYPRLGIAEHSAFVAGKVDFGDDTSYTHPCIEDLNDLSHLQLREDNPWLRMIMDGSRYLAEQARGRYAVAQRGAMAPLDLANALRGNDLFMDFYDNPEGVHRLLDFCVTACAFYIDHQLHAVPKLHGGFYTGSYVWMHGDATGHWSEDASVLCSPAQYREFGLPYTTRLAKRYQSILMHIHTAGKHAYPDILAVPGIDICELANDPNISRGVELFGENPNLFSGKTIKLFVTPEEIRSNRTLLAEKKVALFCTVNDWKEGEDVINFVRHELPIR